MIKLAALFSDHMVFQQGIPLPIWGWADSGEKVTVEFNGLTEKTVANSSGNWRTAFPQQSAGGPFSLTVSASNKVIVSDVMVGEVWLCSGQSNMEWTIAASLNPDKEAQTANYPLIRHFKVATGTEITPVADVKGNWVVASPQTVDNFSAIAYFYARELHQKLGVAIGLINSAVGGTVAEAWTSREGLLSEPQLRPMVEKYEAELKMHDKLLGEFKKANDELVNGFPKDPGNMGLAKGYADPSVSCADWPTMEIPQLWQVAGQNYSGVFWFRKEVEIPASWEGRPLKLTLGPCDKSDVTYFNNVQVGSLTMEDNPCAWNMPREYSISSNLAKTGRNTVAVRIFSNVFGGGFGGAPHQVKIMVADEPSLFIPLAGAWHYKVEHNFGVVNGWGTVAMPLGPGNGNSPYILYHNMIAPLVPFGLRGAIWYQGESNADRPFQYQALFKTLIADWRKQWQLGDFPFYFVQLANYNANPPQDKPVESQWAELREAQTMALSLPNTGMAVTIDIGEPNDIHPKNKQDVGHRLAVNALAKTYGKKKVCFSGPMFKSLKTEGKKLRIAFDYAENGLKCNGAAPTGFAIAGADNMFVWANAAIDGNCISVWNDNVSQPTQVRYGWADNPSCNVYNVEGFPLVPFRSK